MPRKALVLLLALALPAVHACTPAKQADAGSDPVKRGEYLVTIGGCHDCHTPLKMGAKGPEPDMSRMLSGHPESLGELQAPATVAAPWIVAGTGTLTAWAGPWGISYSANLTPDDETGFGVWDEAMFVQAMREGKHLGGGRPILPPMPWFNMAKMTDEDLKAVFAYLKSVPPIRNQVPDARIAEHDAGGAAAPEQ